MGIKLIVAGSRSFADYELLKRKLEHLLQNVLPPIEIISGKAKGADELGERYAKSKGYAIKEFPADWDTYGKKAGPIRNKEMSEYGTHCVLFWDGQSRGTKNMMELCAEKNIPCRVVRY